MMLRRSIAAFMMFCLVSAASAQYRNTSPTGDPSEYLRPSTNVGLHQLRGLLDPSRMHMSHSMSFGVISANGNSASEAMYLNRTDYQISRPLSITTHLGYRFQPWGSSEWNPGLNSGDFVGGAELNWRPSNHMQFSVAAYRGMLPYSPYGYGLRGSRYGYGWPYDYNPYFVQP